MENKKVITFFRFKNLLYIKNHPCILTSLYTLCELACKNTRMVILFFYNSFEL